MCSAPGLAPKTAAAGSSCWVSRIAWCHASGSTPPAVRVGAGGGRIFGAPLLAPRKAPNDRNPKSSSSSSSWSSSPPAAASVTGGKRAVVCPHHASAVSSGPDHIGLKVRASTSGNDTTRGSEPPDNDDDGGGGGGKDACKRGRGGRLRRRENVLAAASATARCDVNAPNKSVIRLPLTFRRGSWPKFRGGAAPISMADKPPGGRTKEDHGEEATARGSSDSSKLSAKETPSGSGLACSRHKKTM